MNTARQSVSNKACEYRASYIIACYDCAAAAATDRASLQTQRAVFTRQQEIRPNISADERALLVYELRVRRVLRAGWFTLGSIRQSCADKEVRVRSDIICRHGGIVGCAVALYWIHVCASCAWQTAAAAFPLQEATRTKQCDRVDWPARRKGRRLIELLSKAREGLRRKSNRLRENDWRRAALLFVKVRCMRSTV